MTHPSSRQALSRLLIGILAAAVAACGLTACGSDSNPQMVPPAPCTTSPTNLSFGTVIVGENKDLSFTLRNTGTAQLAGTVTSPCGDFAIQGTAAYDLAPGDSAAFTVRFAPSAPGNPSCTLQSGTAECASVSCAGVAVPNTPLCEIVSGSPLVFATIDVGLTSDRQFTLRNSQGGTLTGTVGSPCADFTIIGDADYALTAGASKTFTVRWTAAHGGVSTCQIDTGSPLCGAISASGTARELNSGNMGNGVIYQHTFAAEGTYNYHCEIHPGMHGTVVVSAASGNTSASVSIIGHAFSLATVTVQPGATVTWTNNDPTTHTVTSD